jgi:hypothetical protein
MNKYCLIKIPNNKFQGPESRFFTMEFGISYPGPLNREDKTTFLIFVFEFVNTL